MFFYVGYRRDLRARTNPSLDVGIGRSSASDAVIVSRQVAVTAPDHLKLTAVGDALAGRMIGEVRPIARRSIAARAESVIFELTLAVVYARDTGEGVVLGFRNKTVHGHLPGALSSLTFVHFGTTIDVIAGRPILNWHVQTLPARFVATVRRAGVVVVACIHHALALTKLAVVHKRAGVGVVARFGFSVICYRSMDTPLGILIICACACVLGAGVLVVAVDFADRSALPVDASIWISAGVAIVTRLPIFERNLIVLALAVDAGVDRALVVVVAVRRADWNGHSVNGVDHTGVGRTSIGRVNSVGISTRRNRSVRTRGVDAGGSDLIDACHVSRTAEQDQNQRAQKDLHV